MQTARSKEEMNGLKSELEQALKSIEKSRIS